MTTPGRIPSERSFGLSVGPATIGLGALLAWRGHPQGAAVAGAIGVLLVLGALVSPAALRVPNRIWWRFATTLGWIIGRHGFAVNGLVDDGLFHGRRLSRQFPRTVHVLAVRRPVQRRRFRCLGCP